MVEKQIESEEEINAILNLLNQQKAHDFREIGRASCRERV